MPAWRQASPVRLSGQVASVLDAHRPAGGGAAAVALHHLTQPLLRAVAVGVDGQLQARVAGETQGLLDLPLTERDLPAVGVLSVHVGRVDRGARRREPAVGKQLDALHVDAVSSAAE
jgi:hypothetical protein